MPIPPPTTVDGTLLCTPHCLVRPKRLRVRRSPAVLSRATPRVESAATRNGGLICAVHPLRHASSVTQVDDHVPQREHLRLIAHHDLAERLHGCPARRHAWKWIMLVWSGSAVGIRVLRDAHYMRVRLANDGLAMKAIGRVRAFDDLRTRRRRKAQKKNTSDMPAAIAECGGASPEGCCRRQRRT